MARRRDGTALRLEFQLFDDSDGQGRAVYDAIAAAQERGVSKAEFVRRALMYYVAQGAAQTAAEVDQTPVGNAILDKLLQLERKLEGQKQAVPAPSQSWVSAANDSADEASSLSASSGLDMSAPRRRPTMSRAPVESKPVPQIDADAAREKLLASIKAFGREVQRGH